MLYIRYCVCKVDARAGFDGGLLYGRSEYVWMCLCMYVWKRSREGDTNLCRVGRVGVHSAVAGSKDERHGYCAPFCAYHGFVSRMFVKHIRQ